MSRKFLMITTAIVALGIAPATFAAGTTKTIEAPAASTSGKAAAKTKVHKTMSTAAKARDMSAKKDKKGLRAQNAQEVEMTRTLNRDAASGRPVSQMSSTMSSTPLPSQGAMLPPPAEEIGKGVSGPGNQGDNPTSSK